MQSIKGFAGRSADVKRWGYAGAADLKRAMVRRDAFANKNSSGRVLVIGGSSGFHGAPVLASNATYNTLAALRSGAGYARTYVPEKILRSARALSPNVIVNALGKDSVIFNDEIKQEIVKANAIVVGPGIGRKVGALSAATKIIGFGLQRQKKVVADADAIIALRSMKGRLCKNLVATPHEGEFYRMTGMKVSPANLKERIAKAVKAARLFNINLLLKGHYTIITDGIRVKVVRSKSSALATMGTGDVLSGIIGGYAATGAGLFEAAVAGAYLHSRIGDDLYGEYGNHIIATDVIERLPKVLKRLGG